MVLERWRRLRTRDSQTSRWRANFALTAINVIALGALPVTLIGAAVFARQDGLGLLKHVALGTAGTFAATLLQRGFISSLIHFLMHKVPLLWRVHRVHLFDTDLDDSSTVRFHPLESVVAVPIGVPLVVLFGLSPVALVIYELPDVAINLLSHANLRLPPRLHRLLSPMIVTPDLHRIHHSARWPKTDSNFSAVFPLWDIVFGTRHLTTDRSAEAMTLGLHEVHDERARHVRWLLGVPFRTLGERTRNAESTTTRCSSREPGS